MTSTQLRSLRNSLYVGTGFAVFWGLVFWFFGVFPRAVAFWYAGGCIQGMTHLYGKVRSLTRDRP